MLLYTKSHTNKSSATISQFEKRQEIYPEGYNQITLYEAHAYSIFGIFNCTLSKNYLKREAITRITSLR